MKRNLIKCILALVIISLLAGCSSSESCKNDSDCPKDNKCINKKCYPNAVTPDPQVIDPGVGCSRDSECGVCKRCDDGICKPVQDCDAGIIILDASRDIIRMDIEDTGVDAGDISGDVEDVIADTLDTGDISDEGDAGPGDLSDSGTDISDLSGCDAYSTLAVTSRQPLGSLPRGTEMTINGQGFDNECGTLSVSFEGDPNPAIIKEITSSYVKVIVPGFAKEGPITVRSFGQEKKLSGASAFKLTRRMFFSDYGNSVVPGTKFFALSFPNFTDFKAGEFDAAGGYPYPILLDPENLMILVISANSSDKGYVISAYNFADASFIKSVANTSNDDSITSAEIDSGKKLIYLTGMSGNLYIHKTGGLELTDTKTYINNLFGISIDDVNNFLYLSGKKGDKGVVLQINRETFEVSNAFTFGDANSLAFDVIHHTGLKKLFVTDYYYGYLYPVNLNDLSSDVAPVKLGDNCGPMSLALGKNGEKIYAVCNNSAIIASNATASVKGFYTDTLVEIAGSPLDTKLVTSIGADNSRNQCNLVYDELDGYLFVTTGADRRVGVIVESTFTFLSSPQSPDNTVTKTQSGNFGI
ncbi:MAG: IPT/TIG domain-containing protein, partial [Deltaproteobacteria bacterium]|nr:IPT/TIG domain-containing protein [Deltaproteobacteria bacterium]